MNNKVTMQQIADKLGITKVSVSKAINNQPGISDELREEILALARQLGYSKLKTSDKKKTYKFALISAKRYFLEDEKFYTTIYYYINKKCLSLGYEMDCFVINESEEKSCNIPNQLYTNNYNGIFIAGEINTQFINKVTQLELPIVAIDFYVSGANIDSIVTDNFFMGYEVTNYLIKNGHKQIGYIGDISQTSSICDRYFGYLKALRLNNLQIKEEWHLINNDPISGMYSLDFELPDELPTAFVCHCDKAAFTFIQKLDLKGYKVPRDVSIISFDNTSICDLINPKLTSVDINKKQIASYSLDQMLYRLKHSNKIPQKIYNDNKIIIRESIKDLSKD